MSTKTNGNRVSRALSPFLLAIACAMLITAALPRSANAQDAIFTTDITRTIVNQNLYASKDDVYLSGGPRHCGGSGLPDGTYYFQVTDPSGKNLLSSDPLDCRIVTVTDGVMTQYGSAAGGCTAHLLGTLSDDCGGTLIPPKVNVQLSPYDDTPNGGGVYKVWVMPTTSLPGDCDKTQQDPTLLADPLSACAGTVHGFIHSDSKTDNFRVEKTPIPPQTSQAVINVFKFCDVNGNGILDPSELLFGLQGWQINFNPDPLTCSGVTDKSGLRICGPFDASNPFAEIVSEVLQTGYKHTATGIDGIDGAGHCSVTTATPCGADSDCLAGETCVASLTVSAGQTRQVDFGNVGSITGRKFSDLNGNGIDDAEPGVPGVQFLLTGTALDGVTPISLCTNTDANGNYSFPLTPGDNLLVTEVPPPNSIATTPTTCTGSFGDPATPSTCVGFNCEFGNACLGGNCAAKTLGYWKNPGNSSITGADLCALTALNLRDGKGNSFDPITPAICAAGPNASQVTAGRKAFTTWLGNATATNMAYMLSAQLATMTLNTRHPNGTCSLVGVSIFVGTPPTTNPKCLSGGLVTAKGFITLSNLMTDANNELGLYGLTTSGKTDHDCQGFKETALDKANNSESTTGVIDVQCPAVNNPCPSN